MYPKVLLNSITLITILAACSCGKSQMQDLASQAIQRLDDIGNAVSNVEDRKSAEEAFDEIDRYMRDLKDLLGKAQKLEAPSMSESDENYSKIKDSFKFIEAQLNGLSSANLKLFTQVGVELLLEELNLNERMYDEILTTFAKNSENRIHEQIMYNLKSLASAADQYFIETGETSVQVKQLIGMYIKSIQPVGEENYPTEINTNMNKLCAKGSPIGDICIEF